jgi:hypothetical protein
LMLATSPALACVSSPKKPPFLFQPRSFSCARLPGGTRRRQDEPEARVDANRGFDRQLRAEQLGRLRDDRQRASSRVPARSRASPSGSASPLRSVLVNAASIVQERGG